MRRNKSLWLFLLTLIVIAVASLFGPAERSLGTNVRLVYIHGAWVWTALIAFGAAIAAHLVESVRTGRAFFLDHLLAAQSMDNAGKLEWALPHRTTLPFRHRFCRHRHLASTRHPDLAQPPLRQLNQHGVLRRALVQPDTDGAGNAPSLSDPHLKFYRNPIFLLHPLRAVCVRPVVAQPLAAPAST